jgi:lipoyl(octanoyl) transferase
MDSRPGTIGSPERRVQSPESCLLDLGVVEYARALALQRELVLKRQADEIPDTLVLLEHLPVITLGKHADRRHLLITDDELERRGVKLVQVERGGDITFHGPGQLVGYPILKLGPGFVGVRRFVEKVEQALVLALEELGVEAEVRPGHIGVWTGMQCRVQSAECKVQNAESDKPEARGELRKIASIGVAVCRGVTFHGFALNVSTDLSWFELMNPCGLTGVRMTSVAQERGNSDMAAARQAVVRGFKAVFGREFMPAVRGTCPSA